jgi:hypothetical protein
MIRPVQRNTRRQQTSFSGGPSVFLPVLPGHLSTGGMVPSHRDNEVFQTELGLVTQVAHPPLRAPSWNSSGRSFMYLSLVFFLAFLMWGGEFGVGYPEIPGDRINDEDVILTRIDTVALPPRTRPSQCGS